METKIEHQLEFNAKNPATSKQIKWLLNYRNVKSNVSFSQLMKRLEMDDFDILIEDAKANKKIEIFG